MRLSIKPTIELVCGEPKLCVYVPVSFEYTVQCAHGGAMLTVIDEANERPEVRAEVIRRIVEVARRMNGCTCGDDLLARYAGVVPSSEY